MKKIRCYIPNVLLTFLLVFFLLAAQLTIFVKAQALNPRIFRQITAEENLADKAYDSLEDYFKSRTNATGIPTEVYMDVITHEAIRTAMDQSVTTAFDYLNGKTDAYEFCMDFTDLEASIEGFFSAYAEENSVQKDQVYEDKVASVITEAEAKITFVTDTFKFSTMYENGWLETARKVVSYLNLATVLCVVAAVILFILLIVCNLRQLEHLLYWSGLAGSISSLLMLLPCIYVTSTDYFSGFAIKDPQIFAAVVGYLRRLVSGVTTMEIVTLIVSVICFAAFGFFCALRREEAEEKS